MKKEIKYKRKDDIIIKEITEIQVIENIIIDSRKENILDEINKLQIQIDELNNELNIIDDFEKKLLLK